MRKFVYMVKSRDCIKKGKGPCKECVVRSCCTEVCEELKVYVDYRLNWTAGINNNA